jgi:hypothetical protein
MSVFSYRMEHVMG